MVRRHCAKEARVAEGKQGFRAPPRQLDDLPKPDKSVARQLGAHPWWRDWPRCTLGISWQTASAHKFTVSVQTGGSRACVPGRAHLVRERRVVFLQNYLVVRVRVGKHDHAVTLPSARERLVVHTCQVHAKRNWERRLLRTNAELVKHHGRKIPLLLGRAAQRRESLLPPTARRRAVAGAGALPRKGACNGCSAFHNVGDGARLNGAHFVCV